MTVIIPTNLTNGKELVIISKEEYETLVQLREIYEFSPTDQQKKALNTARRNRKAGKALNLDDLKKELGLTN